MTEEDIQEELPDSTLYLPAESLDDIVLPRTFPPPSKVDRPKTLAQAEGRLFERIMDPEAPDDNSVKGVYIRLRTQSKEEDS